MNTILTDWINGYYNQGYTGSRGYAGSQGVIGYTGSLGVTDASLITSGTLAIANGGTGGTTASAARANIGLGSGGPLSNRNKIINGNFDIWQRGVTTGSWVAPINNYYLPDRWLFQSSGTGGNGILSRQAFAVGQTDVPHNPTYFVRWEITSAASGQTTGSCYAEQRIEDVRTLAGKEIKISLYAKGVGTLPNIYVVQSFGSGGSSTVASVVASNVALNTDWTRYEYAVTLPSISGKTIGDSNYVALTFMVPINSTYVFDLAQVQLEEGSNATPFEHRSYGQELALCQRYYQEFNVGNNIWSGNVTSGQSYYYERNFFVIMRAAPTIVQGAAFSSGFPTSAASTNITSQDVRFVKTASSSVNGAYYQFAFTASAEL